MIDTVLETLYMYYGFVVYGCIYHNIYSVAYVTIWMYNKLYYI